jgi:hypothetical protein
LQTRLKLTSFSDVGAKYRLTANLRSKKKKKKRDEINVAFSLADKINVAFSLADKINTAFSLAVLPSS